MRWPLALIAFSSLTATAFANGKPSNPAFLGIGMDDQRSPIPGSVTMANGTAQMTLGPCMVLNVMRGSGAMAAGLQVGDLLLMMDGAPLPNCASVLSAVQARSPSDSVKLDILRSGERQTVQAELISRAEILRRRLVGSPVLATELFAVDDADPAKDPAQNTINSPSKRSKVDESINLAANRGKTTVVGWYDRRCTSCDQVFRRVSNWMRDQKEKPGASPVVYAVNPASDARTLAASGQLRNTARMLDVPLALAEPAVFEEFTVPDYERLQFTVIDCRGVVQYTSSVAPDADDSDAALDDLFAAAEQAARTALER